MAERQIREIKVVIDTQGDKSLQTIAAGFGRVNKSIQQTNGILGGFQNAFRSMTTLASGFIGIQLVQQFVSVADSIQKLTDRLTLSEGSFDAARSTLGKLTEVAAVTKTGIEDIALVYNRLNLSLRDTGISTDALVQLTQALQQSFRLSGATAAEASAATIQLSQGLASSQVRGQELRSVLEANALAGEILAKKLGIARGALLKFAENNGGIKDSVFIAAFAEQMDSINARAEKLQPTIGEALTTAFNKLKVEIGDTNRELGISAKAVKAIEVAGDNLGKLTIGLASAVAGWKIYTAWVVIATKATIAFEAALASPIIGALVAAGVAVATFVASAGGMVIAVAAIVTALISAIALSKDFRDIIKETYTYVKTFLGAAVAAESFSEAHIKAKSAVDGLTDSQQNFVLATPEIVKQFYEIDKASATGYGTVLKLDNALGDFAAKRAQESAGVFNYKEALVKLNEQWLKDKNLERYTSALKKLEIAKLTQELKAGTITVIQFNKKYDEIINGKGESNLKKSRAELAALNAEFGFAVNDNTIGKYSDAIDKLKFDKLKRDALAGRTSLIELNKAMTQAALADYNRELRSGAIDLNTYRLGVAAVNLKQINSDWRSGAIDVETYHRAIADTSQEFNPHSALFVGMSDAVKAMGTTTSNVADGIAKTFGQVENAFIEFTKTGKFVFRDFAMSVLEDLNRIIFRALIIRPIAQGILNSIGPGSGAGVSSAGSTDAAGSYGAYAAKGAYFDGGKANFFASGGVVNGATPFTYGGGSRGVMGEAGPEAIMPLRRASNGKLGVEASTSPVVVNIINQGGGEVEQKESRGPGGERILDIIITQKVKEAFANGAMDRQMSQNYGLRRRGA